MYRLRLEQLNRASFDVKIKSQGKILSDGFLEGIIKDDHIDIELTVES